MNICTIYLISTASVPTTRPKNCTHFPPPLAPLFLIFTSTTVGTDEHLHYLSTIYSIYSHHAAQKTVLTPLPPSRGLFLFCVLHLLWVLMNICTIYLLSTVFIPITRLKNCIHFLPPPSQQYPLKVSTYTDLFDREKYS